MNYALIFNLMGKMLRLEAAILLLPLAIAFAYGGGDAPAFLYTILIIAAVTVPLGLLKPGNRSFKPRDAFVVVALSWVAFSLFGALPFFFAGVFSNYADCLFECVSGFTTTGVTVAAFVEKLPKGILFWRSFTHWAGGLGVLMFMMAVLPSLNASAVNLLRAESTGPSPERVLPKLRDTAKLMYLIYIVMTLLLAGALLLTGMNAFDALTHAFSTAGTGGYSTSNENMSAFQNPAAEIIITVFMFLFGMNFSLYFHLVRRQFKQFFKDEELRFYFFLVLASIAVIAFDIIRVYGSWADALRLSSFHVSSVITTTGFTTVRYTEWPVLSQSVLLFLMIVGSCAGSTSGGIKVSRLLMLLKSARIELHKLIHPQSVKVLMMNGRKVDREVTGRVGMYFFAYCAVGMLSFLLISVDGRDMLSNASAVITMLSNAGPGFGPADAAGCFADYSAFSKIVLSFCMIAGRLEFFPLLVIFMPSLWKRSAR